MTSIKPTNNQPTSVLPGINYLEAPTDQVIYRSGNDYPNKWSRGLFDCSSSDDCEFI